MSADELRDPVIEILWIGEDGNRLVAVGHHDFQAFHRAAIKSCFDTIAFDGRLDINELPSASFDARHRYWRPATREDCEAAYSRRPGDDPDLLDSLWAMWQEDDYMHFTDDPADEPITVLETSA